jgi:hypothetical protein
MAPLRRAGVAACILVALAALLPSAGGAVPLAPEELSRVCAQAEGTAHFGRMVEEAQLKRLPYLAVREGITLEVSLFPSGVATFTDTEALNGGRTFSLWDFVNELNAVVLYATDGADASFVLLQRVNGRRTELPAEPRVSPDRSRLVTADFCASNCVNELAVWRVTRDSVRKEYSWKPNAAWVDAGATWKDAETIVVEYTSAGASSPATVERRLGDRDWLRHAAP